LNHTLKVGDSIDEKIKNIQSLNEVYFLQMIKVGEKADFFALPEKCSSGAMNQ